MTSSSSSSSSWSDVDFAAWQRAMRAHLDAATPAADAAQTAERAALATQTRALHDLPAELRPPAVPALVKAFRAHVDRLTARLAAAHAALAVVAEPVVALDDPNTMLDERDVAHQREREMFAAELNAMRGAQTEVAALRARLAEADTAMADAGDQMRQLRENVAQLMLLDEERNAVKRQSKEEIEQLRRDTHALLLERDEAQRVAIDAMQTQLDAARAELALRDDSETDQVDALRQQLAALRSQAETDQLSAQTALDQAQSEMVGLRAQLADRSDSQSDQVVELQEQLDATRARADNAERAQVDSQRTLDVAQKEVIALRAQLGERVDSQNDQVVELQEQLVAMREQAGQVELAQADAAQELEKAHKEVIALRAQLGERADSQNGQVVALQHQLEATRAQADEAELAQADALQKLDVAQKDVIAMRAKLAEHANLQSDQVVTLQEQLDAMRARADDAERALAELQKSAAERADSQAAALHQELAETRARADATEQELDQLREQSAADAEERSAQLQAARQTEQQRVTELAAVRQQLAALEQSLATERAAASSTGSVLENERQQVIDLQKQLAEQRVASDRLFVEQRRTAAELIESRRAYDTTVDELQAQRASAKQSAQKEHAAEHALAGVQEAAARAEDRARAARAEQAAAEQAQRDAEHRADTAAAKLDQCERERSAASAAADALRAQLAALQKGAQDDAGKVERLTKQLQESVPRQEIAEKQAEFDELERETVVLREMRDRTRNEVLAAEARADAATNELELSHNSLRALDDARLAAEQRAIAAETHVLDLRARIAALEDVASPAATTATVDTADLSDSMSQLEIENSNLKERLDGAREANRTLQQELQALQAKMASAPPAPVAAAAAPAPVANSGATQPTLEASPELMSVVQRLTHDKAVLSQQVESEKRRCRDLEEQVLRIKQQLDDMQDARLANRDLERGNVVAPSSSGMSCANVPAMASLMWRRLMRAWSARVGAADDDLARSR
jgi:chromosome segregation ATPase